MKFLSYLTNLLYLLESVYLSVVSYAEETVQVNLVN